MGETKERKIKRKRFKIMRELMSDDEFFSLIDRDEYDDIMTIKGCIQAKTLAMDLVSVKPMSAPSKFFTDIVYLDVKYTDIRKERIAKIKNLL